MGEEEREFTREEKQLYNLYKVLAFGIILGCSSAIGLIIYLIVRMLQGYIPLLVCVL